MTATIRQTFTMPLMNLNDTFLAMVVLNSNGLLNAADGKLTINGEEFGFHTNFGVLNYEVAAMSLNGGKLTGKGFLMTNATVADKPGNSAPGSNCVTYSLIPVNNYIKASEAEARANAATIAVERAVAKVTVNGKTDADKIVPGVKAGDDNVEWTVAAAALTNTNTKTYLVRKAHNPDSDYGFNFTMSSDYDKSGNKYRFLATDPIGDWNIGINNLASKPWYRTTFAFDPNYSTAPAEGELAQVTSADEVSTAAGVPMYCLENTFDVRCMKQKNATYAIVKMKICPNGKQWTHFSTLNGDETYVYGATSASDDDGAKQLAQAFIASEAGAAAFSGVTNPEYVSCELEQVTGQPSNYRLKSVTVKGNADGKDVAYTMNYTDADKDFKDYLTRYDGCFAYYMVPIKHYGDTNTPWSPNGKSADRGAYPGNDQDSAWLGRYGVVRNNWYDIVVNGVSELGTPVPPVPGEDVDIDELISAISFDVKILSWTKRQQDVTLSK